MNTIARRLLAIFGLLALVLALVWVFGTPVSDAHQMSHRLPLQRMVNDVNVTRSQAGVPALRIAPDLVRAADHYAQTMCDTEKFRHSQSILVTGWAANGENIGMTDGPISKLKAAFEDSTPHYRNATSPRWTHMGVGTCRAQDGTFYVVYRFGVR